MVRFTGIVVLLAAFVFAAALPVAAQPKTGTQFYTDYRAAYAKAKDFNDLMPWMSKAQKDKMASVPAEQQKMMWDMAKQMEVKDVKVLKETAAADGATLEVTGMGPEGKMIKGTVKLVKEDGAWKMGGESWQM